jgi:hypothetical protein
MREDMIRGGAKSPHIGIRKGENIKRGQIHDAKNTSEGKKGSRERNTQ